MIRFPTYNVMLNAMHGESWNFCQSDNVSQVRFEPKYYHIHSLVKYFMAVVLC